MKKPDAGSRIVHNWISSGRSTRPSLNTAALISISFEECFESLKRFEIENRLKLLVEASVVESIFQSATRSSLRKLTPVSFRKSRRVHGFLKKRNGNEIVSLSSPSPLLLFSLFLGFQAQFARMELLMRYDQPASWCSTEKNGSNNKISPPSLFFFFHFSKRLNDAGNLILK